MGEVIMNERKWVENMMGSLSLGKDPSVTLGRVARYYHARGFDRKEIIQALREYMIRCDPYINVDAWMDIIKLRAKHAGKYKMIEIDSISITQTEIDAVMSANGIGLQKLLFTLLCLAKFGNAVNPNNKNWVNRQCKEVFALANIAASQRAQMLMINDLYTAEFIRFSHIIDNTNINVKIVSEDKDADPALTVYDFRNLGNQYQRYLGAPFFECECCGLTIKRRSPRQKVCRRCGNYPGPDKFSSCSYDA